MKIKLVGALLVLSMLAAFTGTALAAPASAGTATLVSVVYVPGKGPVFTFEVSGEFSRADLKGAVHVDGGGDFDLHCSQVDAATVVCTTSKKAAGGNVSVTFGGETFWTTVPEVRQPDYCYSVWDYWSFTSGVWTDFGPHCQKEPAKSGDLLYYTVPDPGGSFISYVWFYEEDLISCPPGSSPWAGPAYYWYSC